MSKRSSSGTTHVSGYYRSNGTYVSGYTRSAPSSSSSTSSRGSSGGGSTVHVSGYTRSDGTSVSGYTRSAPKSSGGVNSSAGGRTVQVSGYTRSDGTSVSGYTRSVPRSNRGASSRGSSAGEVANERTVQVRGYTRSDGTEVSGYTRSVPRTTGSEVSASSGQRCYVDNAYNRKLGRVGKPLGAHVIHSTGGSVPGERYYVDSAHNRRLGRAGKPIPRRFARQQELAEGSTLDVLVRILQGLGFTDTSRPDYQSVLDRLERAQVEESWKKDGVTPSTELSQLKCPIPGMIIPFAELQQKRVIGRGGFGEVYACLWHSQAVAFKKLFYQHMSRKRQDSLVREITILAALDHSNTVKMIGVVVEEGTVGIVMEYLPRSLFTAIFIDRTEFPESKKKEIVYQMASALLYLHMHEPKIAHCDIKSENVLLDGNDNAKLGDFGLSAIKNATESSRSSAAGVAPGQGTPRYSAPEVLRGEVLTMSQLFQADVYSLAVVAFEVVVEEEPFDGLNVKQLEANVGRGDLRPTSTVALSQQLSDLFNSSWDDCASKRPKAAEFSKKWNSISDLYR